MQTLFPRLRNNIIICGHFGAGKTNVAVGTALAAAAAGKRCGIVDLDIVNPYFRTADALYQLRRAGVDCHIPQFANTNVDIPSVGGEVSALFAKQAADSSYLSVFDVGGDNGAVVLGSYRHMFESRGYSMVAVINQYRPLTETPTDVAEGIADIEACSGLRVSAVINNSNLGAETDYDTVANSLEYAEKSAKLCGLELLGTTLHSPELYGRLQKDFGDSKFILIPNSTKKLF